MYVYVCIFVCVCVCVQKEEEGEIIPWRKKTLALYKQQGKLELHSNTPKY